MENTGLAPVYLTASEAARCVAMVRAALPAIQRQRVICHGDLIPTNLLHHADESITFTDLEGFMSENHPLFDVLAFFTTSTRNLLAAEAGRDGSGSAPWWWCSRGTIRSASPSRWRCSTT